MRMMAPTHHPQPVAPTQHLQPVAPTHNLQPVAPTHNLQPVAPTHNLQPVAPTHHLQLLEYLLHTTTQRLEEQTFHRQVTVRSPQVAAGLQKHPHQ